MNTPTKVGIGLISLILICGGTPLFFYAKSDIPEAAGKLKENLARARRAGLWTNRNELIASYKVPGSENAAPILTNLLAKTHPILNKDKAYWKEGKFQPETILTFYRQIEPHLTLIEEADSKPRCKFPRDLRLFPTTEFSEYSKLRSVWKLLGARAGLAIQQDDLETAKICWRRMMIIAEKLSDENFLFSDIARTSLSQVLNLSFQFALNQRAKQTNWVDAVSAALERADRPHDIRAVLSHDLLYSFDAVYWFEKNPKAALSYAGGNDKPPAGTKSMRLIPGIRSASYSRFAQAFAATAPKIDIDQRDSRQIRKALDDLDKMFKQPGSSWVVPSALAASFGTWGEAIARNYAQRAVLRNSIRALRGQKLDLTSTPDFDLNPLRTKQVETGQVIYSIGSDKKDNGGDLSPAKLGASATKDFGVLIPR